MRTSLPIAAVIGACLAFGVGSASAQDESLACAKTRAEVRADCNAFMKTHMWDEGKGEWVAKSGGKAAAKTPEGVPTSAQIRAERNKFLASNRWDDGKTAWVPIAAPRDMGGDLACDKTRSEVQADCKAFMKTHRFDEGKGTYVPIKK
jgi:hypothetical protein